MLTREYRKYRQRTFTGRLVTLLLLDVVLTIFDSYVPHELWAARDLFAAVIMILMAVTMGITLGKVLEDY